MWNIYKIDWHTFLTQQSSKCQTPNTQRRGVKWQRTRTLCFPQNGILWFGKDSGIPAVLGCREGEQRGRGVCVNVDRRDKTKSQEQYMQVMLHRGHGVTEKSRLTNVTLKRKLVVDQIQGRQCGSPKPRGSTYTLMATLTRLWQT